MDKIARIPDSIKSEVDYLLVARTEAINEVKKVEHALQDVLINFEGTLMEALEYGLVKPSFPVGRMVFKK